MAEVVGTSNAASDQPKRKEVPKRKEDLSQVYVTFIVLASLGVLGALLYAITISEKWSAGFAIFGGSVLISGAFSFVGGLIGFLFAIPRSRQDQLTVQAQPTSTPDADKPRQRLSDYAANTNLEQISDWLTKILVGIGLVQFGDISLKFGAIATSLAPLLGSSSTARPFAVVLMTYFIIWGFFFAYLATRLWMPKALSRAEHEEEARKLEVEKEAELRALRALEDRAYQYLYEPPPGGYTRAINEIEAHHAKEGAPRSGELWMYLASAYGQRHADETREGNERAAQATKERAIAAVREALTLNPSTRPILEQMYRTTDASENDLATLRPALDEVLSK